MPSHSKLRFPIALTLLSASCLSMAAPMVFASLGEPLDRSPEARANFEEKVKLGEEEDESFDAVMPLGCSWYCGGQVSGVTASSVLKAHGDFHYDAENAHDNDARTAWVEGQADAGINAWLEYELPPQKPRVTAVILHNGIIASEELWHANGRVKTLLLSVNGVAYRTLVLADSMRQQRFDIGEITPPDPNQPLRLRFTILDVFAGRNYQDVGLSELYFDGNGVH
jgi:hypothetical protein